MESRKGEDREVLFLSLPLVEGKIFDLGGDVLYYRDVTLNEQVTFPGMKEVGLAAVPLAGDRLPVMVREFPAAGAPD